VGRVYNFSAGPAVLPEEVLKEAAAEMLDYRGTGMSVMEMSHRSKAYETIINEAEQDIRDLMQIPDNYKVLFLQGGASQQFAMIPMNLMKNKVADYIITGQWAKKAYQEAQIYGKANAIASSADKTFSYIPDCSDLPISEDADYVYICENNTIYGTKYKKLPNTKGKTLVADVSSCFLSEPVDVSKYGVIYGGVQKILKDVTLTIKAGEYVAIVGASGSGKSTLMRLMLGFEKPEKGTVSFDGIDLADLDLAARTPGNDARGAGAAQPLDRVVRDPAGGLRVAPLEVLDAAA
jgi:phosphoserine aminotransferase